MENESALFSFYCGCSVLVWAEGSELKHHVTPCSAHVTPETEMPLLVETIRTHQGGQDLELFKFVPDEDGDGYIVPNGNSCERD